MSYPKGATSPTHPARITEPSQREAPSHAPPAVHCPNPALQDTPSALQSVTVAGAEGARHETAISPSQRYSSDGQSVSGPQTPSDVLGSTRQETPSSAQFRREMGPLDPASHATAM